MFVGLDLHKNYLQTAVMDEQGRLLSQERIPNKDENIEEFASKRLRDSHAEIVIESSSTWYHVYELLSKKSELSRCSVQPGQDKGDSICQGEDRQGRRSHTGEPSQNRLHPRILHSSKTHHGPTRNGPVQNIPSQNESRGQEQDPRNTPPERHKNHAETIHNRIRRRAQTPRRLSDRRLSQRHLIAQPSDTNSLKHDKARSDRRRVDKTTHDDTRSRILQRAIDTERAGRHQPVHRLTSPLLLRRTHTINPLIRRSNLPRIHNKNRKPVPQMDTDRMRQGPHQNPERQPADKILH